MSIDMDTLLSFLAVKTDCTVDDLVRHINLVWSNFNLSKVVDKETVMGLLREICLIDKAPYHLKYEVIDDDIRVWRVVRSEHTLQKMKWERDRTMR